jgi:deazaflavin-dependent oxidoreductase (nitroreductase family)
MSTVIEKPEERVAARDGPFLRCIKPAGRFTLHFVEMCAVMCVGAVVLSVLFFMGAAQLGYTDLPQRAPALSVFVIAVNLSLPMAVWMRFRGMQWRPTLEMAGSTMIIGLLLIVAYWLGIVPKSSLIDVQTSLACPLMLAVMLFRFRLYSAHGAHHGDGGHRNVSFRRTLARFNKRVANPVMRLAAGRLPPLAIVRHRGRVTGREYATPVLAFATADVLVVGMLYGTTSDWARNVLAAGHAEVKRRGTTRAYGHARLIGGDDGLRLVPVIVRPAFRLLGVHDCVGLTVSPGHVAHQVQTLAGHR